jgi:isoprenylcysteine carboxyl methyltransferase (ICMT) family protein YpbQ
LRIAFIAAAVLFRLASLALSIRHERRLRAGGAAEYGAANTALLALAHTAFYIAAIAEYAIGPARGIDALALAGLALYGVGAAMLVVVIRGLGRLWTVKLLIARDHALVTTPLFRWVRHPNYLLNILPELVGFALALHATWTLAIGLPLYAVPLAIRIRQEEAAMRAVFPGY